MLRLPAQHGRPSRPARHPRPRDEAPRRTREASARRSDHLILGRCLVVALLLAFPAAAEPIRVTASGIDLHPRDTKVTRVGQLEFVAGFELSSRHSRFGGYSGMVVDEGGKRLVAVSDLGHWLIARLVRDADGKLRGVGDVDLHPILDRNGNSFTGKRAGDAEGLDKLSDGSFIVSFEQIHRIVRYAGPEFWRSRAEQQVGPADLSRQAVNGGVETIARLADGRLLMISETEEASPGVLKAWIGVSGTWRDAGYRRRGDYVPVDAKLLPDGDLLVLERGFTLLGGFSSRVVRVPAAMLRPGAVMEGRDVAEIVSPLTTENYEALAVETAPDGGTFVFLMSDDNRITLQRTLLLQFRLIP